jgi:hypothetical protein
MKKVVYIIVLFLGMGTLHAQKVKMKKGKVLVDKKEYLTYERNKFFSKGLEVFTLEKQTIEKENPNKNQYNASDPQLGDRYKPVKVRFLIVKFKQFSLEYETTLSKSKLIKHFYKEKIINDSGMVDKDKARAIAKEISKPITGKRPKIN